MYSPYSYIPHKKGYFFVTDNKSKYFFYFLSDPELYRDFPKVKNYIFNFGFELMEGKLMPDKRISLTIRHIINNFFEKNPRSILTYTCESLDGKHHCRNRLFQKWYSEHSSNKVQYTKVDMKLVVSGNEIYNSALMRSDNKYEINATMAFLSICMEVNTGKPLDLKIKKNISKQIAKVKKKK